ncbi:HPP family protein [Actinophytocola sp. NPDC049390]|uniref:HPP family protein n=1 Tax=Actinophytocola sp. NPDC049390 TaxID=3363894 RepID=UPI0037B40148
MSATERGQVREVMTPDVLGIVPSAPLEVALRMMVETGVHHLPVVDRGHCLGVAHESDVLWRLWSGAGGRRSTVGAMVREPPLAVQATDPVRVVARRMVEAGTDAALVLQGGSLVGIVTGTDLLRLVADG